MKKALIVYGGWDGHDPVQIAELYREVLQKENFEVEMSDTLDAFADEQNVMDKDLIIPHWTNGSITTAQLAPVLKAVTGGTGIAGCHAGMCDAFHDSMDWQWMTGGQWVCHPGGQTLRYRVSIVDDESPITEGMEDFYTESEQYYLHVDPAIRVLATTRFPVGREPFVYDGEMQLDEASGYGTYNFSAKGADSGPHVTNGIVDMPVAWTKTFGLGRVFYSSLGHIASNFSEKPVMELMRRGMLWAAR